MPECILSILEKLQMKKKYDKKYASIEQVQKGFEGVGYICSKQKARPELVKPLWGWQRRIISVFL